MRYKGFLFVIFGIIIFAFSFVLSFENPDTSTIIHLILWICGIISIILGAYQLKKQNK